MSGGPVCFAPDGNSANKRAAFVTTGSHERDPLPLSVTKANKRKAHSPCVSPPSVTYEVPCITCKTPLNSRDEMPRWGYLKAV